MHAVHVEGFSIFSWLSPEQSTGVPLAMKTPEASWAMVVPSSRGRGRGLPLVLRGQQRHLRNAVCLRRDPRVGQRGTC